MSATEKIVKLIKSVKELERRLTEAGLSIKNLEERVAKLESTSDVEQREIIGRDYARFKKSTQWQPDREQTKQNKTNK
jgi:hypothetical protein